MFCIYRVVKQAFLSILFWILRKAPYLNSNWLKYSVYNTISTLEPIAGGFGLSSSTILYGRSAGRNVVLPKASGLGWGLCLNRWNSMGSATYSLVHRARVYYLLCGPLYNELCHAIGIHSLLVPPSTLLNMLCTKSIKAYIILNQK